jgi:hypothetical protein
MVSMRLESAMAQRDILRDESQRGKRLFVLSRLKASLSATGPARRDQRPPR